jgi:bifunctional non-homologous end joining protein LigD
MLAEPVDQPFDDARFQFEPKLDGYRILAFIEGRTVRLQSRRGLDYTQFFPVIAEQLRDQRVASMVLDGEILALANGKPSFNALQNRAQLKGAAQMAKAERETPAIFYCFDLLHFAGRNLRDATYADRRRFLAQCLLPSANVQLVATDASGVRLYDAALAAGFEGVMAKRRDSKYEAGRRSRAWLKVKAVKTEEFLIGGYTKGEGARTELGALLLGSREKGGLRYVGHVGSGFDDATLRDVQRRLKPLQVERSPFKQVPPLHRPTVWVKPELAAEVKFAEETLDGYLRAPVFLRLRDDIDARKVSRAQRGAAPPREGNGEIASVLEQLDNDKIKLALNVRGERVSLTNLDRVYWPTDRTVSRPSSCRISRIDR